MKVTPRVSRTIGAITMAYLFFSLSSTILVTSRARKNRRWCVRPINRQRDKVGAYATLIQDMWHHDEEQFFKYTRMTKKQFLDLLQIVKRDLKKDRRRKSICPRQRLLITLHYLSEGCSMQEMAWSYRLGKTTIHKIIKETCAVLWQKLQPLVLEAPSKSHFEKIEKGFFNRWNLPNCIGAVDGKHIIIMAPKNSGSTFFNYKKTFSLVLMATCDAYYRFSMVDIGGAGAHHDSAIFRASGMGAALLNDELDIPLPKPLPNMQENQPHFLVGDAAFPLHKNIIRPYPGSFLDEKKKIFNYRISRGRRVIENTFGILSQRWRILRKPICASKEVAELITMATVVLHNFLQKSEEDIPLSDRKYCPTGYVDSYDEHGFIINGGWRNEGNNNLRSVMRLSSNNYTRTAKNYRENLADYFVSREGSVPWQENYVNRGGMPEYYY